ncbi:hypothetical protein Tco_1143578 [Tanacetum coccineum]
MFNEYYNLPPRTVSPVPVAIVASRAVDPVGSPSSTTNDQDEQSTSTSPTNQEIQSQVTHQGPVPQFMAPDHSSSGPVLHEMTSDQIRSDLTPNDKRCLLKMSLQASFLKDKRRQIMTTLTPCHLRSKCLFPDSKQTECHNKVKFLSVLYFEEYTTNTWSS